MSRVVGSGLRVSQDWGPRSLSFRDLGEGRLGSLHPKPSRVVGMDPSVWDPFPDEGGFLLCWQFSSCRLLCADLSTRFKYKNPSFEP